MSKFQLEEQLQQKVAHFISHLYNLVNMYLLRPILCESCKMYNLFIIAYSTYSFFFSRWMMEKDTIRVTVREGNTELEDGSLVISGYDVSGHVTSEEEAVSGVTFVLFGVRTCCYFIFS